MQLKGWYSKDDVVAEWKRVNGEMCLHIHCYVSGLNLLLDLAAEFRYHIFSKEMPLVSFLYDCKVAMSFSITKENIFRTKEYELTKSPAVLFIHC